VFKGSNNKIANSKVMIIIVVMAMTTIAEEAILLSLL
jgi:hypothetical protein